jgi:hypothetical protein
VLIAGAAACGCLPGGDPPDPGPIDPTCDPLEDTSTINAIPLVPGEPAVSCNNNADPTSTSDLDVFAFTLDEDVAELRWDCDPVEGTGAVIYAERLPATGPPTVTYFSDTECQVDGDWEVSEAPPNLGTFFVTVLHPPSSQKATLTVTTVPLGGGDG